MQTAAIILSLSLGQYGPWVGVGPYGPMGAVSQPSGILDWSRSWAADWTTGTSTPTPTIECEAAAADGEMTCVGATASKQGNPTTGTAAGYPSRYAAVLDGTGDYYDLGDTGAQSGDFSVCLGGVSASGAGGALLGRYAAADRSWILYRDSGAFYFYVCKDDTNCTATTGAAVAVGLESALCFSYDYVADGTSIVRGNVNGTAVADKTNAVGPLAASAESLKAGYYTGGTAWTGKIAYLAVYSGTAFSAADLAALVASQQARLASKPAGALVTVTSGATKAWDASGNVHSLPANSLAASPTGAGMEIWGAAAHSNALPTSTTAGWTPAEATVADLAGPDGSATSAFTITDSANAAQHTVSQDFTGTAAAWVFSAYLKAGDTRTWAALLLNTSFAFVNLSNCTLGTVASVTATAVQQGDWCRVSISRTLSAATWSAKIYMAEADADSTYAGSPVGTLLVYAPKAEVGTVAGPIVVSAGTPVSGTADAATVASQSIDNAKGAVGAKFTTTNTAASTRVVAFGTANTTPIYISTPTSVGIYDGTTEVKITVPSISGVEQSLIGSWSGSTMKIETASGSVSNTGAYDGSFGSWTTLNLGSNAGTSFHLNGSIRCVCQGKDVAAVRKCLARCP